MIFISLIQWSENCDSYGYKMEVVYETRHTLITWLFCDRFPYISRGIRNVFIWNMSTNIHDFCWYYKDTSRFQWTVIVFYLKSKWHNYWKCTSYFNMWNYSLNTYLMVTYRDVWHEWLTPPFRCTCYIPVSLIF